MQFKKGYYHVVAILVVAVWGLTFISTKLLIQNGLSPQEIFFYRFLMAYIGIWMLFPRRLLTDSWKDELWMMAGGVAGGSFYFFTENTALEYTQASNVSFLICTAPLLTTFLSLCLDKKEKASKGLIYGSLLALLGVGLVVFNGSFVLKLSPMGDFLTLLAALSWAFYSLIIRRMSGRYPAIMLTRKVFFYGLLTILPLFCWRPFSAGKEILMQPVVWGNLIFLGVLASLVCYVMWSIVLKQLGTVKASNYIYLNPLVTMVASSFILQEQMTPIATVGAASILVGIYWAERSSKV